MKGPVLIHPALGHQEMKVGVKIDPSSERLNGHDDSGHQLASGHESEIADQGSTWGPAQRLTWSADVSRSACAAVDSSNIIHIVWMDWISDNFQVFYRKSADGGSTWPTAQRLTWTAGPCMDPIIERDLDDYIYVMYTDQAPAEEIYARRSTNGGLNWGAPIRLTWNSGRSIRQNFAINSYNILHIVWDDDTPGNNEIFQKWSTNRGLAWSVQHRLSWNSGNSVAADIIADNKDNLHLVWSDIAPGNFEIFYRNEIGGSILKEQP